MRDKREIPGLSLSLYKTSRGGKGGFSIGMGTQWLFINQRTQDRVGSDLGIVSATSTFKRRASSSSWLCAAVGIRLGVRGGRGNGGCS